LYQELVCQQRGPCGTIQVCSTDIASAANLKCLNTQHQSCTARHRVINTQYATWLNANSAAFYYALYLSISSSYKFI